MFEKEAEEYVPNIKWHDFSSKDIREEMMLCYRKGAEFGYNKALEEATHNYNAIIADYDKRIAELKKDRDYFSGALDKQVEATLELQKKYQDLMEQNDKAKELIKNIIRVTWGEGWNYSIDWKVKAEQFLKEVK